MGCGKKVLVTFSATKTQPCRSNNLFCWCWNGWRCAWSKINFWEVGFDFHLKVRLRLLCCLCSKNFWKNWSFALFYGISVYLYKSTIQSCMGYCCHGWAGAPKYYLDILGCRNDFIRLLVLHFQFFLERMAHRCDMANLSLFYRYYFGKCFSELDELVPFPLTYSQTTTFSER